MRNLWTLAAAGSALVLAMRGPEAALLSPGPPDTGSGTLVQKAQRAERAGEGERGSRVLNTKSGPLKVEQVAWGLEYPWALAHLPDGRMLVTERPGRLRIVTPDGKVSKPVPGTPRVLARGQGGLLDVALDPQFQENGWVYLSYAEPGDGGSSTAVARAKLTEGGLKDLEVVFRQVPKIQDTKHYGSRLVFAPDGTLFVTLGERFTFAPAQDLSNHLGTIVRIKPDGAVPQDNPFVGNKDARPEIWSYGHRNIEAAAVHPGTGALWVAEMGPLGGDELNIAEAGRNYGWPVVSWGRHYDGRDIPDPPERPDLAGSVRQWTPVISPSGMTFYDAELIPVWKGSLLIGGLSARAVVRLSLEGDKVTAEERLPIGARVRDVRQGPDGALYVLTDEPKGRLLRLAPASAGSSYK